MSNVTRRSGLENTNSEPDFLNLYFIFYLFLLILNLDLTKIKKQSTIILY